MLKPVFKSTWISTCPLYFQHTSEWPDCGGGQYQLGGCHSAVCCYSAEEHQRHSEVSPKSFLNVRKKILLKEQCLFLLIKMETQSSQRSHWFIKWKQIIHTQTWKGLIYIHAFKWLYWNLTHCILNQITRFLIGREKPGTLSEVARLISETLEQEKKQQQRQQHLDEHYEHSTEEVSHQDCLHWQSSNVQLWILQCLQACLQNKAKLVLLALLSGPVQSQPS